MIGFLKRIFGGDGSAEESRARGKGGKGGGRSGGAQPFDAPVEIDMPTYAIGDVHGRADLLERLLGVIAEDAQTRGYPAWRLLTLGDLVDRGEDSAQVLGRMRGLLVHGGWQGGPSEVHALRGNHEEMMLGFAADPAANGARWLRNGGLQTLMSFRIGGVSAGMDAEALAVAGEAFGRAAAADLEMARELPAWLRFGNVIFAHAGCDPEAPPELQSDRVMLWGVSRFFSQARKDRNWVVYGHYAMDEPSSAGGRIGVDTGAYYSGVLTAVRLETGEEPAFLST